MTDKHTQFIYNDTDHSYTCVRTIRNKKFIGHTRCHPGDYDFESKLVGEHYAYMRALIKELADRRDTKRLELKALRHLYNILEQNKNVCLESEEMYTIRRQIKLAEDEIRDIRELIKATRFELHATIISKDTYYKALRERRKKNEA